MSKPNTFENDLLKLIFNGTALANVADCAANAQRAVGYFQAMQSSLGTKTQSDNAVRPQ